ncbi:hypothetical protein D918_02128 [Trichuris suis]|nr:hypothetical protein D918_02128 [Trichuris suis]
MQYTPIVPQRLLEDYVFNRGALKKHVRASSFAISVLSFMLVKSHTEIIPVMMLKEFAQHFTKDGSNIENPQTKILNLKSHV